VPRTGPLNSIVGNFHNSEAAFQATKWWGDATIRAGFEACETGGDAFSYKKTLHSTDWTYAGLGRDGAMKAVLEAKFSEPALKAALLSTGGATCWSTTPRRGWTTTGATTLMGPGRTCWGAP